MYQHRKRDKIWLMYYYDDYYANSQIIPTSLGVARGMSFTSRLTGLMLDLHLGRNVFVCQDAGDRSLTLHERYCGDFNEQCRQIGYLAECPCKDGTHIDALSCMWNIKMTVFRWNFRGSIFVPNTSFLEGTESHRQKSNGITNTKRGVAGKFLPPCVWRKRVGLVWIYRFAWDVVTLLIRDHISEV